MFICKQTRAQRNCSLFLDSYKDLDKNALYSENTVFLFSDSNKQTSFILLTIKMSKRGLEHPIKVIFHL